jgi:putative thioredoxin
MATTNYVIEVSEASFQREVVDRSKTTPVVVDFWAPWCGPCRMLGPLLERLTAESGGSFVLAKVNVDENPRLSTRFGIQGIPAVKGFRDGRVVSEFVGAQPEPNVRKFLKQLVPDKATGLLEAGRWPEAEAALREALAAQPGKPDVLLGLARALLGQGRGCEAAGLLEQVAAGPESTRAEALKPLAQFLCDGEKASEDGHDPLEAQFWQAARLAARWQFAPAMDGLIDILRQDKRYRKDEPRRIMLAMFAWLGEDNPITQEYRRELASALF